MSDLRRWPCVLGVTFLALVPRLGVRSGVLDRSLSYDELFTLTNFSSTISEALTGQRGANNHPFASLLAWAARQFSEDELVLRLPFALLGALAAGALCWALWPVGRRRAWLAGGLLALAPPAVLASQQVRGYSGAILFGALSLGAYLRCARRGRLRDIVGLGLFGALGLWSHATLLLGLGALALATLRYGPGPNHACRRGLAAALTGGLLLYWGVLSKTFKFVIRNLLVGPAAGYHPGPLTATKLVDAAGGPALAGGLLALGLWGIWISLRAPRVASAPRAALLGRARAALVLWALAPLPLLLLGALGYGRFSWFAWPAWAALGAAGCLTPNRHVGTGLAAGWLLVAAWALPAQNRSEIHDLEGAMLVADELSARLNNATVLAIGPGSELLPLYGQALAVEPDQAESILPFLLMEPAVIVVPLPVCLDEPLPTREGAASGGKALTFRDLLSEAELADPIVLPGLESPVVILFTR